MEVMEKKFTNILSQNFKETIYIKFSYPLQKKNKWQINISGVIN